jgi:hypothetical protein
MTLTQHRIFGTTAAMTAIPALLLAGRALHGSLPSALDLARIQFGFTISFHIVFPARRRKATRSSTAGSSPSTGSP